MSLTQPMERMLSTLLRRGQLWYGLPGGQEGRECPRSTADALVRRGLARVVDAGPRGRDNKLILTPDGVTEARRHQ